MSGLRLPGAQATSVYCNCGRLAAFRLPVRVLEADLATTYNGHLDLCEVCYRLEASSVGAWRGGLPFGRLLLVPDLRREVERLHALEHRRREG